MRTQSKRMPKRGFALVVTLSLMILLTVIAVGMLTLASISLRATGNTSAMSVARANAKMALMLAIGDLQKAVGPDTRITAPANLVNASAPVGVTGAWKSTAESYSNPDYVSTKTGENFLGYLISNPDPALAPDPSVIPAAPNKSQMLVGKKSVGITDPNREISAPMVPISGQTVNSSNGAVSWVTLDEGTKARIDLLPEEPSQGVGESITQVGSAARNGFETVEKMSFLKDDWTKLQVSLPKLVSFDQANLEADAIDATAHYFHDFTVSSSSLQTDVVHGGLKTDLSVLFDGEYGQPVDPEYASRYLYSGTDTPFQGDATTSDVQWSLLANYSRLYRRSGNDLTATLPSRYRLKSITDTSIRQARFEPDMASVKEPILMPTVVRVDTVFSLVTHDAHHGHGTDAYKYMLHLMYLPVITLHNPYNVPLRVNNMQVEFSDIPVGFEFLINGQPSTTRGLMPINELYVNAGGRLKTFSMLLSNRPTSAAEVVMGPGETRIFGTPFTADGTWGQEVDKNGSSKGFFDWQSNQTGAAYTMPGMITGPSDGIGFDVDWLAPSSRSSWLTSRKDSGVIILNERDDIKVRYGPAVPSTATRTNSFAITVKMRNSNSAVSQVFYGNSGKLKTIMEEGVSVRFPETRRFPETWPRRGDSAKNTMSLYEANGTKIKDYTKARPFAVFSVGAKTTNESFTKSRPVADTGIAFQMATCDFSNSTSAGASPLEFALVPVQSSVGAIESGGVVVNGTPIQGYFFGGNGLNSGSTNATFFEVPKAPLQSIAQLRHANFGSIGSAPYVTYTVGESRAHPAIPSNAAFLMANPTRMALDHSWLANDQLWDRYWFSTLSTLQGPAYTGASSMGQEQLAREFFANTNLLPNHRNAPYLPPGHSANEAVTEALTPGGKKSAAYVVTKGGFNVNSTSVPAWIAVLSSLATSDVPLIGGNSEKDPAGTPFLRLRQSVAGQSSNLSEREKLWNGYRTLDDNEIKSLAEEIVAEVKSRGPFLSLAEFVNRRLGSSSDLTSKGAIQAALDRININAIMESNARPISPSETSGYGWENNAAITGNTGAGAPGEVSQGDVLSTIGSFISVRSDTFRIRAYGDSRNANGEIVARAWCEATLQRMPEYVDPTEPSDAIAVQETNVNFGRQFKLLAFRWLHPEEI